MKATCLYLVDTDDADSAVGNCKDVVNGVLRFEPGLSPGSPRRLTIERFPDRSEFPFHLANVLGKEDRFEEAEEMFLRALRLRDRSRLE